MRKQMIGPGDFNWITVPRQVDCRVEADQETGDCPRPTWWLRHEFVLETVPSSLTFELVCLGYYELYVNGRRVGDEPLAPSISRLDRRGFVIAHEITEFLELGNNCVGLWCSSGWYLPHQFTVHEGATPLLGIRFRNPSQPGIPLAGEWLCRESNRFITDGWKWNQFGGEEVDARRYLPEWKALHCDTSTWLPVRTVSPPDIEITERTCPPNRIGETYRARSVRNLGSQLFEVDFGTCLSGWVDIRFGDLEPGQTVKLRFFDLPADNDRNRDHSYGQWSVYHASGNGNDRFTNKFNYAGFRYMTIEGLSQAPPLEDMQALLVESALDRTGHFRCSNELFNRIHDMNLQTLRCLNLGGYSVDCPSRERNGYGADGQTSLPAYLYLFDSAAFFHKWLIDWCDVYEPDSGRIPLCAPTFHAQHAPAWGGIVAPLAWSLYVYYGDRDALEVAFPVIRGYLGFLQRAVKDGVMRKKLLGSAFHADWVPARRGMDSGNTPDQPMRELFNSCYLIYLYQIFVKICRVIGHEDCIAESETCMTDLRAGIHRDFYDDESGYYLIPEQAYQAMPLLTGVVPEKLIEGVKEKLIGLIAEQGWHMDAGLPGATLLLRLLSDLGQHEVIGKVYNNEAYPGWGYMLSRGATTIWEQWNGFWSQIHSCFAGPAAWLYEGLAGIRPDEHGPGFKSFILAPAFLQDLDFVEASYDSVAGRIESAWKRENGRINWSVTVPRGSRAQLHVPVTDPAQIRVNGQIWRGEAEAVKTAAGRLRILLIVSQGSYELCWAE